MRTPYEISDEDYAAKVAAVGAVDVLCCHIPPDVPELLYDVVARRMERGSSAVLDAIRDTQPDVVLFGHVHNPLASRTRIGRTECVNVGHFRGRGTPYVARSGSTKPWCVRCRADIEDGTLGGPRGDKASSSITIRRRPARSWR